MALATHVVHAIVNGEHAKRMGHAFGLHAIEAAEVVFVAFLGHPGSLLRLCMFLDVGGRVGQVACSGRIAATNRTLLEVALENIAPRKGITTQHAHVRAFASVSKAVALQVLGMEVRLGAMRAREFAIGVLDRNGGAFCSTRSDGRGGWMSKSARQDTTSALRTDNVRRLLTIVHARVRLHH